MILDFWLASKFCSHCCSFWDRFGMEEDQNQYHVHHGACGVPWHAFIRQALRDVMGAVQRQCRSDSVQNWRWPRRLQSDRQLCQCCVRYPSSPFHYIDCVNHPFKFFPVLQRAGLNYICCRTWKRLKWLVPTAFRIMVMKSANKKEARIIERQHIIYETIQNEWTIYF